MHCQAFYGLTDGAISGTVGSAAWQALPASTATAAQQEVNVGFILSVAADASTDAAFVPLYFTVNGKACVIIVEGAAAAASPPLASLLSPPTASLPPPPPLSPSPPLPSPSCPTCLKSLVVFGDSISDSGDEKHGQTTKGRLAPVLVLALLLSMQLGGTSVG